MVYRLLKCYLFFAYYSQPILHTLLYTCVRVCVHYYKTWGRVCLTILLGANWVNFLRRGF